MHILILYLTIITIIGHFQRKPVSPSQADIQPTSQPAQPHQVDGQSSHQHAQPPLPYAETTRQPLTQRKGLSHPRIAVIGLIAQVLLFAAVAGFSYESTKSGSGYNLLNTISFLAFLGGVAGAITAFVMSLLKTRQLQRWGWFASLILGFFGLFIIFLPALIPLLFGIFGPKEQKAAKTQPTFPKDKNNPFGR